MMQDIICLKRGLFILKETFYGWTGYSVFVSYKIVLDGENLSLRKIVGWKMQVLWQTVWQFLKLLNTDIEVVSVTHLDNPGETEAYVHTEFVVGMSTA